MEHALRPALPADMRAIVAVHAAAFGGPGEAEAVLGVLTRNGESLSMVATIAGDVVAHVLFSPVALAQGTARAVGLAPLAVLPRWQYRGIGTHLARAGCTACAELGCDGVFVLGAPRLYRRAGFVAARTLGFSSIWPGTSEAFQARQLRPNGLAGCGGLVRYVPEFDRL